MIGKTGGFLEMKQVNWYVLDRNLEGETDWGSEVKFR